jgi:ketosteroid isomerase-like protein
MRPAFFVLALLISAPLFARGGEGALAAADAFEQAIARADEAQVRALLAPDVLIYEMGGQEASLEEYAAHHMKADMEFMRAMERKLIGRTHGVSGDLAWVATRRRVTGTYKDKPVELLSTETLVLRRAAGAWKIVHVQWSSQSATPKK